MDTLERHLEIYRREAARARRQTRDWEKLVKQTEKAIKERDSLLAQENQEETEG